MQENSFSLTKTIPRRVHRDPPRVENGFNSGGISPDPDPERLSPWGLYPLQSGHDRFFNPYELRPELFHHHPAPTAAGGPKCDVHPQPSRGSKSVNSTVGGQGHGRKSGLERPLPNAERAGLDLSWPIPHRIGRFPHQERQRHGVVFRNPFALARKRYGGAKAAGALNPHKSDPSGTYYFYSLVTTDPVTLSNYDLVYFNLDVQHQ